MAAVVDLTVEPDGLTFRPMGESDLATIIKIELSAYPHPWTLGIFRDCLRVGYCCWVFERQNEIVAYSVMSITLTEAHILNFCVKPSLQRQGLGAKMLMRLLDLARRRTVDTVLLEVRPSNKAAVELYRQAGFCEVGTRRDYYPDDNGREDALIMAKSI